MEKICKEDGCERLVYARKICTLHYNRYRKAKGFRRIHRKNNEMRMYAGVCRVTYYDKRGDSKGQFKIDIEDWVNIKDYKWCVDSGGYVMTGAFKPNLYLARFLVFGLNNSDLQVDHINRDPLDNRKRNLRKCTHFENCINRVHTNNTSGHPGVYLDKRCNKWRVQINAYKQRIDGGRFDNLQDAIIRHKELVSIHHGAFAPTHAAQKVAI